jgi:hypothetical protein
MGIKSKFLAVITALALLSGVSAISATPATAASVKVTAGAKCQAWINRQTNCVGVGRRFMPRRYHPNTLTDLNGSKLTLG